MDAGGMDAPFPPELFHLIDIFSPNESELSRLTGIATESFEQITQAVLKCHKMVSFRTPKTIIITKALFLSIVNVIFMTWKFR
jgi:pyridoxal/pyridoxine/pyridoxamine kinase